MSYLRVISGTAKSIQLVTPEGNKTRPTTDRIKETLFNMINFDLPGATFLDLFSGSGAMGIEALSRGAKKVVFIDNHHEALACIQQNLNKTKLFDKATVVQGDVVNKLQYLGDQGENFDIIFMDPPYKSDLIDQSLSLIRDNHLLNDQGFIIVEHSSEDFISEEGFNIYKEKKYKTTTMTFLSQEEVR
ncbi:16S rRNA (guanine(966)-N(2))-methyltransferase RsmD [Vallitalea okinawensis]|uniref:16S rRNA (guanine(966)-N(2))-methyltransferase RsmD n=1 Tax=Vallitalea okinawensis TaxID=2078660 RepID=UPI002E8E0F7F|nr:16S rRNA (guanine(966)-N(2))-methyltransferase RsmD [Vallitalea okinawensis]